MDRGWTVISCERLSEWLDMMDWYRRCLEDVMHRVPVRGLDEAKHGYDRAYDELRRRTEAS